MCWPLDPPSSPCLCFLPWDRRAVCSSLPRRCARPQGSCPFLHLRWGRFFLLCSYQLPVNGFPCFLCSSAPGYRGVLCRLSGIWDMSPLDGQNPRRAGEDSPPERGEPATVRLLLPCRWPGVELEAPGFTCCVLPVWKMCQEAVAPLGRGWSAVSGSPQEHGVAWKRWVSSVHQGSLGTGLPHSSGHARPSPPHRAPRVQPLRTWLAGLDGEQVSAPLEYEEGEDCGKRAVS